MSVINQLKTLGQYMSGNPDHRAAFNGHLRLKHVVTTLAAGSAQTLTMTQLLGGVILRDGVGAARTDTTPTATQIINALGEGVIVGSSFDVYIKNVGSATELITIEGGTGVTIDPTVLKVDGGIAATFEILHLRFIVTNVLTPAVTVFSLGIAVAST